jgi:hypothetical protein
MSSPISPSVIPAQFQASLKSYQPFSQTDVSGLFLRVTKDQLGQEFLGVTQQKRTWSERKDYDVLRCASILIEELKTAETKFSTAAKNRKTAQDGSNILEFSRTALKVIQEYRKKLEGYQNTTFWQRLVLFFKGKLITDARVAKQLKDVDSHIKSIESEIEAIETNVTGIETECEKRERIEREETSLSGTMKTLAERFPAVSGSSTLPISKQRKAILQDVFQALKKEKDSLQGMLKMPKIDIADESLKEAEDLLKKWGQPSAVVDNTDLLKCAEALKKCVGVVNAEEDKNKAELGKILSDILRVSQPIPDNMQNLIKKIKLTTQEKETAITDDLQKKQLALYERLTESLPTVQQLAMRAQFVTALSTNKNTAEEMLARQMYDSLPEGLKSQTAILKTPQAVLEAAKTVVQGLEQRVKALNEKRKVLLPLDSSFADLLAPASKFTELKDFDADVTVLKASNQQFLEAQKNFESSAQKVLSVEWEKRKKIHGLLNNWLKTSNALSTLSINAPPQLSDMNAVSTWVAAWDTWSKTSGQFWTNLQQDFTRRLDAARKGMRQLSQADRILVPTTIQLRSFDDVLKATETVVQLEKWEEKITNCSLSAVQLQKKVGLYKEFFLKLRDAVKILAPTNEESTATSPETIGQIELRAEEIYTNVLLVLARDLKQARDILSNLAENLGFVIDPSQIVKETSIPSVGEERIQTMNTFAGSLKKEAELLQHTMNVCVSKINEFFPNKAAVVTSSAQNMLQDAQKMQKLWQEIHQQELKSLTTRHQQLQEVLQALPSATKLVVQIPADLKSSSLSSFRTNLKAQFTSVEAAWHEELDKINQGLKKYESWFSAPGLSHGSKTKKMQQVIEKTTQAIGTVVKSATGGSTEQQVDVSDWQLQMDTLLQDQETICKALPKLLESARLHVQGMTACENLEKVGQWLGVAQVPVKPITVPSGVISTLKDAKALVDGCQKLEEYYKQFEQLLGKIYNAGVRADIALPEIENLGEAIKPSPILKDPLPADPSSIFNLSIKLVETAQTALSAKFSGCQTKLQDIENRLREEGIPFTSELQKYASIEQKSPSLIDIKEVKESITKQTEVYTTAYGTLVKEIDDLGTFAVGAWTTFKDRIFGSQGTYSNYVKDRFDAMKKNTFTASVGSFGAFFELLREKDQRLFPWYEKCVKTLKEFKSLTWKEYWRTPTHLFANTDPNQQEASLLRKFTRDGIERRTQLLADELGITPLANLPNDGKDMTDATTKYLQGCWEKLIEKETSLQKTLGDAIKFPKRTAPTISIINLDTLVDAFHKIEEAIQADKKIVEVACQKKGIQPKQSLTGMMQQLSTSSAGKKD